MLYIFVLGRDAELSKLEIDSLLNAKKIKHVLKDESNSAIVIDSEKIEASLIDELGGTLQIAEVISNSNRLDQIEDSLNKVELYTGTENKIEYYIDSYNTNLTSFVEDYLKDYFKSIKLKAIYKRESEPSKLISKDIINKGMNIVVFKNFIGKVFAATNPGEIKRRDLDRPAVDYKKVISIRLAKILINISEVKPGQTLLDPMCGSGTILHEAMLKGINVIGTDKDEESIKQTEENIKWVKNKYKNTGDFKIFKQSVKGLSYVVEENSVNGVVTEPYMGPFIRLLPNMMEAQKLVIELTQLYSDLFINLKRVVKKNGKVVMIVPRFRTRENKTVFIDFKSIIDKNNFIIVNKPIDYGYKDSKLLRQIYVLEKV